MMKSEIASPLNRKKTHELSDDDELDFLSMLPDDIIVSILSRLTIAEAARTSVVSVRWRYLWTYYFGSLYFDASLVRHDDQKKNYLWCCKLERERFKKSVYQVLNSLQTQTLEAFGICFHLENDNYVDNWVQFAIQKKVKKLDLHIFDYTCCAFPPSLFKLSSFPSLQVLRLSFVNVSGKDLEYLLSSCSSLQTLSVLSSQIVGILRVCSHTNLKELEIRTCNKLKTIEISAENLMSFRYYGSYVDINFQHIPNLKQVCFGGMGADRIFTGFFHLAIYDHSSYLKVLKLDISTFFNQFNYKLSENMVLANLQHLEMNSYAMQQNVYDLCVFLLNRCPSLRSLTMKTSFVMDGRSRSRTIFEAKHAYNDCLEEVKLVGFSGQFSDVRFIKYIIQNATNLKKLLVGGTANKSWTRIRRLLAPFMSPRVEFVIL